MMDLGWLVSRCMRYVVVHSALRRVEIITLITFHLSNRCLLIGKVTEVDSVGWTCLLTCRYYHSIGRFYRASVNLCINLGTVNSLCTVCTFSMTPRKRTVTSGFIAICIISGSSPVVKYSFG